MEAPSGTSTPGLPDSKAQQKQESRTNPRGREGRGGGNAEVGVNKQELSPTRTAWRKKRPAPDARRRNTSIKVLSRGGDG